MDSYIHSLDIEKIRSDFPILKKLVNNYPLIYLDNASTTQKPKSVINAIYNYYSTYNANVHRAIHNLSNKATQKFECVRKKVKQFINAKSTNECIFVRGATEAINLVANSFVMPRILPNQEILITYMEHHSNIVPWQEICKKTGAILKFSPVTNNGEILIDKFERNLNKNTKFVSFNYASNALGIINPIKKMIKLAHDFGALVLVDGAQSTAHLSTDVQDLNCDFYVFSGHKMYGPTGIGILWGKEELLDRMIPYQYGGEMINYVTVNSTEYSSLPYKFEAGTPNIAGVIGLGYAIDYLNTLNIKSIMQYENYLLQYTTSAIQSINGFNIIGKSNNKIPILSLIHNKIHAHDIDTVLDRYGIAIRSGHHCTMPLMNLLNIPSTIRISLSFYNTINEIKYFIEILDKIQGIFL